jgi:TetR/AcrR family transcriptional regulator, cholesterol catabolism regulator
MSADSVSKNGRDKSQSTADRLLAGAAELFRRKGYAATTTRELSAHLGIQNASLYYHMDKKEDLLYKLCLAMLEDVAAVLDGCVADASDPLEQLKLIVYRYTTTALRDRDRHAVVLIEIRALSEERRRAVVERRDMNVAIVRRTIAAAQKARQIRRDMDPKYVTLMLFNLMNWSIFWYRPDGELTPDQVANLMSTLFLEGANAAPKESRRRS